METEIDGMAAELAKCRCAAECDDLYVHLLRLLAEGRPVSVDRLAAESSKTPEHVTRWLSRYPAAELDSAGQVIGAGITLTPTPHRFLVGRRELYTWCAWDTLIFPMILKRRARVKSVSPATGADIRLIVNHDEVEEVKPENAVVSMVVPEGMNACSNTRSAFCDHSHFFRSPEEARPWKSEHPSGRVLSVTGAYALGRSLLSRLDLI